MKHLGRKIFLLVILVLIAAAIFKGLPVWRDAKFLEETVNLNYIAFVADLEVTDSFYQKDGFKDLAKLAAATGQSKDDMHCLKITAHKENENVLLQMTPGAAKNDSLLELFLSPRQKLINARKIYDSVREAQLRKGELPGEMRPPQWNSGDYAELGAFEKAAGVNLSKLKFPIKDDMTIPTPAYFVMLFLAKKSDNVYTIKMDGLEIKISLDKDPEHPGYELYAKADNPDKAVAEIKKICEKFSLDFPIGDASGVAGVELEIYNSNMWVRPTDDNMTDGIALNLFGIFIK